MQGRRAGKLTIGAACVLAAMGTGLPAAAGSVTPAPPGAVRQAGAAIARQAARTATGAVTWRVDARLPLDTAQLPREFSNGDTFLDVEAVGPHDAWAVGSSGHNILWWGRPLLRHWHNGRWLTPSIPRSLDGSQVGGWVNELQAVGGSSPSDVWALGVYYLVTETIVRAVHWNGSTWTKAPVPSQGSFAPLITSVVSFGSSGAWAFGCYCGASQSPYIAHFSGGRWHDVTPSGLPFGGIWTASAISASDIWAVMSDTNTQSFGALHWNGVKWASVPMPSSLTTGLGRFFPGGGLAASRTGGVWFAGSLVFGGAAAVVHEIRGHWTVTKPAAASPLVPLVPDGTGGLWSASETPGTASAQIWHFSGGQWRQAANPAGTTGFYRITWMAHLPGGQTALAIGGDLKNELLLSAP
jgi:hypothetical protein